MAVNKNSFDMKNSNNNEFWNKNNPEKKFNNMIFTISNQILG